MNTSTSEWAKASDYWRGIEVEITESYYEAGDYGPGIHRRGGYDVRLGKARIDCVETFREEFPGAGEDEASVAAIVNANYDDIRNQFAESITERAMRDERDDVWGRY
jgi:hypothetical protein